ncbi:hypothetical protein [Fusibacter sp. JL216-2]|uniref:hypothetical protein n=1 Tax=Fusibacter sp. JL216-2 TaxID=3071453 RepID=UPI003D33BB5A
MNNGLLILEDGRVLSGKTNLTCNAFGKVCVSGNCAVLTDRLDKNEFALDQAQDISDSLIGKIVVDTLPVDYHMYDVKNAIF